MFEITMPKAGQSMEEGTIISWLKEEGDEVEVGDVLLEVETDKAVVDVESTQSGTLRKILRAEDEIVPVLAVIAFIGDPDEEIPEVSETAPLLDENTQKEDIEPKSEASTDAQPYEIVDVATGGRIKASPAAKRLAKQRGIDLSTIGSGSGVGGRIVSSDITSDMGGSVRQKMSPMRRAIASSLTTSKQTIPHFYMKLTIDASPLYDFYRSVKEENGCSLNDIIILACASAIREFAHFRSRIDGGEIEQSPSVNIGIAVGIDEGLVVPVITGAGTMTLKELASESRRVVERAREGKLEGSGKGCFTITNLGMFGVEEFSAIINPPESAILAVGSIREGVIVKEGAIRAGKLMTMTLSCDHRLIDGVVAAKFLERIKKDLEDPAQMISDS
jgi:pyruvate dehydrogenase E2 component (dihydrolipoyllysine-residue acetyltransferase)